jgi:hypothetical protein
VRSPPRTTKSSAPSTSGSGTSSEGFWSQTDRMALVDGNGVVNNLVRSRRVSGVHVISLLANTLGVRCWGGELST